MSSTRAAATPSTISIPRTMSSSAIDGVPPSRAARLADAEHDVGPRRNESVLEHRDSPPEHRRQGRGRDLQRAETRRQAQHRLEGGVDAFAAERLEPGDEGFHGARLRARSFGY